MIEEKREREKEAPKYARTKGKSWRLMCLSFLKPLISLSVCVNKLYKWIIMT